MSPTRKQVAWVWVGRESAVSTNGADSWLAAPQWRTRRSCRRRRTSGNDASPSAASTSDAPFSLIRDNRPYLYGSKDEIGVLGDLV